MADFFIYSCKKSIGVYEESKKYLDKTDYKEKIFKIELAGLSIGRLIPHTNESLWSGHFFPWSEAWDDLQISYNLCLFGLYKQAMVSLRSGLELGLLSVYWNINDDGHKIIRDWIKSNKDTPRLKKIWNRMIQHRNFQIFQEKYDIKTRLFDLGYLHNYVHTKGHKYSNKLGLPFKPNFQTFEEQSFKIWYDSFEEVIKVLGIMHLVKYPIGTIRFDYSRKFGVDIPSFGGLDEGEIDTLEKLIGKDTFSIIELVASKDGNVKSIMDWITPLKDMTEEQVENQIRDMDKGMIEQQGLENWLSNEKRTIEFIKEKGGDISKTQSRIKYLTEWAKKNGYEKPKWERKKPKQ